MTHRIYLRVDKQHLAIGRMTVDVYANGECFLSFVDLCSSPAAGRLCQPFDATEIGESVQKEIAKIIHDFLERRQFQELDQ